MRGSPVVHGGARALVVHTTLTKGTCTMRTMLRRMVALLAITLLGGTGVALATAWSPTAALVAPAAADDDDGGGDDDDGGDGGQAPAGGVDTGLGGAAGDDDGAGGDDDGAGGDDDGGDDDGGQGAPAPAPAPAPAAAGDDDGAGGDDDSGQVPAGGVQTGFGGTAETVSSTSEPANGLGDVAKAVAPAAAVGLGGYALLRARAARSDGAA